MQQRLEKLKWLIGQGINPYPYKFEQKNHASEILEKFKKLKKEQHTKTKTAIAGRIMSFRVMGKASFAHVQDETGRIQIYVREDKIGDKEYEIFRKLDIGDIIGVSGLVFRTKMGEITIEARKILRPLPEKWHGLKDIEARYRQRYVDLIVNPEVKKAFIIRGLVMKNMREFLEKKGFIEVDTPVLQPIYGGGNARPFKTFLYDIKMNTYLRISNELYLKRLIVGGFEKIFEFSKDFRNESIDSTHNPEFILMETMWAYADYKDNMKFAEEMITHVVKKVLGKTKTKIGDKDVDWGKRWERIDYFDSFKQQTGIDLNKNPKVSDLSKLAEKVSAKPSKNLGQGRLIDLIYKKTIRPKIIQPSFLINHPVELMPLAKKVEEDPTKVQSFQLICGGGLEVVKAYTELNDPLDQEQRFKDQLEMKKAGWDETQELDESFVDALKVGLPPTAGWGMGIERFAMILTDQYSIKEVIPFPTLRPEK